TVILAPMWTAAAQKGSAPPGFYPNNYNGDTFTGEVVAANDRELTLAYHKRSNTELFVGTTESACMAKTKQGQMKELHLTAIPKGTVLTAFYNSESEKQPDGTKKKANVIIAVRFDVLEGQKLTNPDRPVISCSN